jgi:hypothetical protein
MRSYRVFIVVDEESFQMLLSAPPPEEVRSRQTKHRDHFVNMVEAWPEVTLLFKGVDEMLFDLGTGSMVSDARWRFYLCAGVLV